MPKRMKERREAEYPHPTPVMGGMKLEEAIERGELAVTVAYNRNSIAQANALKLLIEAGKRVQSYREKYLGSMNTLLPGETEE